MTQAGLEEPIKADCMQIRQKNRGLKKKQRHGRNTGPGGSDDMHFDGAVSAEEHGNHRRGRACLLHGVYAAQDQWPAARRPSGSSGTGRGGPSGLLPGRERAICISDREHGVAARSRKTPQKKIGFRVEPGAEASGSPGRRGGAGSPRRWRSRRSCWCRGRARPAPPRCPPSRPPGWRLSPGTPPGTCSPLRPPARTRQPFRCGCRLRAPTSCTVIDLGARSVSGSRLHP